MSKNTRFLTHAAVIAALYAVLTHLQNVLLPGSATWAIQMRLSEALCVLSFGASAATPVPPSGNQDHTQVGIAKATDVEAGSNIAPGSRSTGQSMSDAFNVHTLVAGEWS